MLDDARPMETAGQEPRVEAHLRALHAYWNEARRGQDVPKRADIDPRRIEPLLSNAFIAERIAPGVTRLRVAGMHLSEIMGMEVRGMPLSCLIAPPARDAFALHLVGLFEGSATLRMELRSPGTLGRPEMRATLLMLPLRSDLGDVSRTLVCLVTRGASGRAPRRFEIMSCRATSLAGIEDAGSFQVLPGGLSGTDRGRSKKRGRAYLQLVT
ncbi:PAS domain-containing protein [Roseovarius tolerans]|uniref:PAS domain-containing protein n=1 Tax=Roseovarius tolerans TaxID=74031 RepID=A0A1H7VZW6_9RHOB|nr:PAS domain-containing protein [Roseovarius tolerans]SEM14773.1 PAS domain-containing protein [Roseovarius tolerans]